MPRLLPLVAVAVALSPGGLSAADPPPVPREFRAAWVATVANIDWPSRKGLPADDQKKELLAILDKCRALRLNAVVFQVRPMADALYLSELEPWSEFLTGEPGKSPGYDPLAFAVAEAHARGLELHAWFNPYRAWQPAAKGEPAAAHLVKARPDLAKPYGKHHWMNPTHPDVRKHSLAVMLDVVERYDVDGVHMDDYFYPYPEKDAAGAEIPFPDDDTWAAYQKAGGKLSRDDWRRDAVNGFVKDLYAGVKKAKPWVKVGISPFGIWRPGNPPGIEGFDQYGKLYADAKLWLTEGWVDYFTPQLYWPVKQEKQSYPKLLGWWAEQNPKGRHLWPGLYTSKHPPAEIAEQIKLTRGHTGATGHVHFSMKAIMANKDGIADELARLYAGPALVPASPWLTKGKPAAPKVGLPRVGNATDFYDVGPVEGARWYVIRTRDKGGEWTTQVLPAEAGKPITYGELQQKSRPEVVITAVDRFGVESDPATVAGAFPRVDK